MAITITRVIELYTVLSRESRSIRNLNTLTIMGVLFYYLWDLRTLARWQRVNIDDPCQSRIKVFCCLLIVIQLPADYVADSATAY